MDYLKSITLAQPPSRRSSGTAENPISGLLPVFIAGPENANVLELLSPESIESLVDRSPILLYGGNDVGKTAIALTVAARWSKQADQRTITVTSGSDFARQFAHAIQADDMDHFRRRHRRCRMLVIEAVHEVVGKPAAQEELTCTLDALIEENRPVIVTSNQLPGAIRGLRSALSSRLMGGWSINLVPPGQSARFSILRLLALQLQANLTSEELNQLATGLPPSTTARQLQGILAKWLHQQRMDPRRHRDATLEQLIVNQNHAAVPSINLIAKAVAKRSGLTLSDLRAQTRKSNVVRARGLAMLLARQLTPLSYQQIGDYFGGRDHTTVLHACRKTEVDLDTDTELLRASDEIRQLLQKR